MDMKRFFLYAIVIAALALAGCGGNGGGGSMAGGGDMSCPAGQTGTPPNCVTPTPPSCLENPDAANCTGPTQAAIDAATKVAGTKKTAITAEAAQTTNAGLGGSDRTDEDGTVTSADASDDQYSLEISRDRDGTEVKITDSALANPKFTQAMDLGSGTTMHTRMMAADSDGNVMEEVVMVTTDIEAPKATAFAMVAGQSLNANAQGATATGVAAVARDLGGALTAGADGAILENVEADSFIATSGTTSSMLTFNAAVQDDPSTANVDETKAAAEIMGTYNGAMGTYKCTGSTDCTVNVNAMGELSAMSDGWIFIPAAGATSDVSDADYLYYGFWLKKTTDNDGVLMYNEVETFAGSSVEPSGSLTSVLGKATYNGGATGVYVHSVVNQDGTEASATSGHFRANATLTATFGQVPVSSSDSTGTIAANELYTLTGIINSFQLSGHDERPGWSVTLEGDIGGGTGGDSTVVGTAKGGMGDGSFSGMFHGDTGTDDNIKPGSVVGEFNAGFSNGSVAGAFGARMAPQ